MVKAATNNMILLKIKLMKGDRLRNTFLSVITNKYPITQLIKKTAISRKNAHLNGLFMVLSLNNKMAIISITVQKRAMYNIVRMRYLPTPEKIE